MVSVLKNSADLAVRADLRRRRGIHPRRSLGVGFCFLLVVSSESGKLMRRPTKASLHISTLPTPRFVGVGRAPRVTDGAEGGGEASKQALLF